jgi:large subunit ribosomal protein L5
MRLKEFYQKVVVPEMMKKFKYKNPLAVPKVEKVVINVGFGKLASGLPKGEQEKIQNEIAKDLALISGQKPVFTKARKSISGFKLKKGAIIGAKVTLRRKRMYDFLEKLIYVVLPRIRDFKGISLESFDQRGNLTIGIKEQTIFPEILPEEIKVPFGLEINICLKGQRKKEEGIELLKALGFPIKTE